MEFFCPTADGSYLCIGFVRRIADLMERTELRRTVSYAFIASIMSF